MRKYFINSELQRSSFLIIGFMSLFLAVTMGVLKINNDNMKKDYIKTLGAVAAKLSEINPEIERNILPIIVNEPSQEEVIMGEKLLKEYGLTKNLDNELFPYVKETSLDINYKITAAFVFMTAIFFLLNYFQYGFFYKRIRALTIAASRVVEGDYNITINENKEGDLSKLAVSFNSMREIIKKNISDLKKEKNFLVDLLSDISHQLKTPLSSMIVYNDIMMNKELTTEQRETFLLNNENQLNRMNWLIQSILKLAKVDARAIEFHKEKESLGDTIEEAIEALESKAFEKNINITFNGDKEVVYKYDSLWMEEALINIIKNSIEHSKAEGKIEISLIETPIYIKIVIEDNGEGISEEDLPNIFKRFYKGKTSKKSNSIGIGLALSKSVIEAHDGFIEAESRITKGTKFIITFIKY